MYNDYSKENRGADTNIYYILCKIDSKYYGVAHQIATCYNNEIIRINDDIDAISEDVDKICAAIHAKYIDDLVDLTNDIRSLRPKYEEASRKYMHACNLAKTDRSKINDIAKFAAELEGIENEIRDITTVFDDIKQREKKELSSVIKYDQYKKISDLNARKLKIIESRDKVICEYTGFVYAADQFNKSSNLDNALSVVELSENITDEADNILISIFPWYTGLESYIRRAKRIIDSHNKFESMARAKDINVDPDVFKYTGGIDPLCKEAADHLYIQSLCDIIDKYGSI